MTVVILDRNKQYYVNIGDIIKIDKINLPINSELIFDKILCLFNNNDFVLESDILNLNFVSSKILLHFKEKKTKILKFKRRKGYLRRFGCRQSYTLIKIISINNI